jgi:nucleoside-diphosphate-sugar epimerase
LASIIKHTNNNAQENIYINTKSTQNIFELGRKIGKIKKVKILCASTIGTVACFDNEKEYADEESEFSQKILKFPYYYSKMLIEKMSKMYNEDNLDIIFIRPPVIYGENDIKGRATKRIKNFLNKKIVLYTKGNIPFCDIEDLTKITYQIMKENEPKPVYNIDGVQIPLKQFFETLEDLSGEKKIKIYVPYYLGMIFIYTFRNLLKLPDIVELQMGNYYWNSQSKYFKNYEWCNYKDTLKKTINYIRKKDKEESEVGESKKYTFYNYLYISAFFLFISKIFY